MKQGIRYPGAERGDSIMMRRFERFRMIPLLVLALMLLPLSALAVTENRLEPAPLVNLPEAEEEETAESVSSYLPVSQEMPERRAEGLPENEYRLPRLTDTELDTARYLMTAPGFIHEDYYGYANCETAVTVGVYPLDPADYDGETFYVILPAYVLDEYEVLSLISAFEELGIPFDPDSLNERNCCRGGGSATRFLSYEESERMNTIRALIHRDMIAREDIAPETSCTCVYPTWSDTEPFRFFPYRSMTDEELAAFVFAEESAWETNPFELERSARKAAHRILRLPLTMKSEGEMKYETERYGNDQEALLNTFSCNGADGPGVYLQVCHLKYGDGTISLDYICGDYETGWGLTEEGNPKDSGELKAAARQWAQENLRLPEEEQPADWTISDFIYQGDTGDGADYEKRLTVLSAETPSWEIELIMYRNSARIAEYTLTPRK